MDLRDQQGRSEVVESLQTRDIKVAQRARWDRISYWNNEFERIRRGGDPDKRPSRDIYLEAIERYASDEFTAKVNGTQDKHLALELESERIEGLVENRLGTDLANDPDEPLPKDLQALVDALDHVRRRLEGRKPKEYSRYLPSCRETGQEWLKHWKREQERQGKDVAQSNTYDQYASTLRLFSDYWDDKPLAKVRPRDGAHFRDVIATLDPSWGRSKKSSGLSFEQLLKKYGDSEEMLSAGTLNRHMRTLAMCWDWAKRREIVSSDNPFKGLTLKVASNPYQPWSLDELRTISASPPKRQDLYEVFLVGLYSGMRVNEIAALTWENVRKEQDIWYFDITQAKSDAGVRQVPVHSSLGWLLLRPRGADTERLWPDFNPHKRGKAKFRPGDDVSSKFGDYKRRLGFQSRLKSFHSLRKNVTKIAERKRIRINEWQEIIGHEKGLTFGKGGYNPDGITLKMKQEAIEVISYPEVVFQKPDAIYRR